MFQSINFTGRYWKNLGKPKKLGDDNFGADVGHKSIGYLSKICCLWKNYPANHFYSTVIAG